MILFVSDKEKMNERLSDLKAWLLLYSYPIAIVGKAKRTKLNAKLQGLLPKKRDSYSVCINTI